MSLYSYNESLELANCSFDALIMAAMRRADTDNLVMLQNLWPDIWSELVQHYNAPGGKLPYEV